MLYKTTNSNLKILLEHINKNKSLSLEKFPQTTLEHLYVDPKTRSWTFIFHSEGFLNAELLIKLYLNLRDYFLPQDINTSFNFKVTAKPTVKQLNDYWHLVLMIIGQDNPFTKELSSRIFFVNTDEGIKAYLPVKAGVKFFSKLLGKIKKAFSFLGVDLPFVFSFDKEREMNLQKKFENSKEQEIINSTNKVKNNSGKEKNDQVFFGNLISPNIKLTSIDELSEGKNVTIEGLIFKLIFRKTRRGGGILTAEITDYTNSVYAKIFSRDKNGNKILQSVPNHIWVKVRGRVAKDNYLGGDLSLTINSLQRINKKQDKDELPQDKEHRVELHAHSNMTTLSAVNSATDLFNQTRKWGQKALAITDNANVQAFPEISRASKKNNIKPIYGAEINYVEDNEPTVINTDNKLLADKIYTVFDIETTGLSAISDKIIQLSAVKIKKGNIIDRFDQFINPGFSLSEKTINLTGITDDLVKDSLPEKDVLSSFQKFYHGTILAGHNVIKFDYGFINQAFKRNNLKPISSVVIDTLNLSRWLHPELKKFTLDSLSKKFNIKLQHHHRAIDDAQATGILLYYLLKEAEKKFKVKFDYQLNEHNSDVNSWKQTRPTHLTILVKNQKGLKDLYKLISKSNIDYFYRVPRVPRSLLNQYRENFLIGSGDTEGELFDTLVREGLDKALDLSEKINFDYIELQPLENYEPKIESKFIRNKDALKNLIKNYIKLSEIIKKPLVVTGDIHYALPKDRIYRTILVNSKIAKTAVGREINYNLADLSMKKTQYLLNEFSFLGEKRAYEIVVKNTNLINNFISKVEPLRKGLSTPKIEGANSILKNKAFDKAKEMYGNPLPKLIENRLNRELRAIISNGYAVIYVISQRLVSKSNKDGYIVGSRGSVGSSLVATMLGITEVNPLPPHYRSVNGNYTKFINKSGISSGYDLPEKKNPVDGTMLIGDGQNIPFETFLGFKGNKVPDIDLNFSGDYQPIAHNYTKVMFGENNVFRAGTIGTVAEKTAYGMVKSYEDKKSISYRKAEEDRLSLGISGVKRTTGQHAGGIIIIPNNHDVFDFTPIQYPANDTNSNWKTTHLDYHSIHDNVLKMDILGHDDPTLLRSLQDMSGVNPKTIPVNDPGILSLFTSPKVLGVTKEQIMSNTGTLGIPEFGTNFVRGMLKQTKPHNFGELLQISGLSHGTNVWNGNADRLIEEGKANISSVIGTRDKIMTDLTSFGLDSSDAFQIMEKVRKGKGIPEKYMQVLKENSSVPQWYINSMQKIQYMFPRAHAAAYVLSALRIAYFKVYFPTIYYSALFSVRAKDLTIDPVGITQGKNKIQTLVKNYRGRYSELNKEESKTLAIYEIVNEAWQRGIEFKMVDLYKSEAFGWKIEGNKIILPFIALPGLGDNVAKEIVAARSEHKFISKEDLMKRGSINKTLIDFMDKHHMLDGLTEKNQMDLFSL